MNEIKKIHLGRQPFTISVDAHKLMQSYLEAIEAQVGAKSEVLKEVESRMAELLLERGVAGEKVILIEDVEFLKDQLGDPGDFKDEESQGTDKPENGEASQKRLYRDTNNAMIAGVCSGLAAFFGIDATIVRLIFVVALFFGGAAIPVYLVLWLVMPEAKTPSERLQMQGKAVTVDSLKELVERADVKGAADRASKAAGPLLQRAAQITLAAIGSMFVTVAILLFVALTMAGTYLLFHRDDTIAQTIAFPVGSSEVLFTVMAAVVAAILSFLMLFTGMSMMNRKWSIPGWLTATLVGIMVAAGGVGSAVGPDTVYGVRDRYKAVQRVSLEDTKKFTSVSFAGTNVDIVYEKSDKYQVGVRYVGRDKPVDLKYIVKDGQLEIDGDSVQWHDCEGLCIMPSSFDEVIVRAPKLDLVITNDGRTWHDIADNQRIGTDDYHDYSEEE